MNKHLKTAVAALLLLGLLASLIVPAFAQEPAADVTISTAEDLLALAQDCVLDRYSENLTVSLAADLDLSGTDFRGIPSFSGTFEGNHHTISGLSLNRDGSVQGLFRYLTETAVVTDLTVHGKVLPGGSRRQVGGIVGKNAGTVRGCTFQGEVSGTDCVGGIAGTNTVSGVIEDCFVTGSVHGNHFVGGIAGQMEPVSKIEFSADTLQILRGQLASTSGLADRASSNIHRSSQELSSQMSALHTQADAAAEAVRQLLPSKEQPHFPDPDTVQAARNTLSSSVSSMQSTMASINELSRTGIGTAASDIRAITGQINAISSTLDHAAENLGGRVTDASDRDTEEDLTGKVLECENLGAVDGDLNLGGIAGSVSWENDLDHEEDFQFRGEESLNFDSELRAVILRCRNTAPVTAKKRCAGGIAGNLSLGLCRDCVSTGDLTGENAQYVGGIAGTSEGFLRGCSAKCRLEGRLCIGGIAGTASVVSSCRSVVSLPEEGEQLGAVLGTAEESGDLEAPVCGNFFLPIGPLGAVDGISYAGAAEPLGRDEFLALEDLPADMRSSSIRFVYENGSVETVTVPLGEALEQLPQVPEKKDCTGRWAQLEELDLAHIWLDLTVTPVYESRRTVIESDRKTADGRPLLLAEGSFTGSGQIPVHALETLPQPAAGTALEGWVLPDFGDEMPTSLHLAVSPEGKHPAVLIRSADGTWREAESRRSGSYLVFDPEPGDNALCLTELPAVDSGRAVGLAGAVLAAAAILLLLLHRRRKKTPQENA